MHYPPSYLAHIDQRISDEARDSVRGSATKARAMANALTAELGTVYDALRDSADGGLDLSGVTIAGAKTDAEKVAAVFELHSKLHGANAALNEISAMQAYREAPEPEATIGEIVRGGPRVSDVFERGIRGSGASLSTLRTALQANKCFAVSIPEGAGGILARPSATLFKTSDGFSPQITRTGHVQIDPSYGPFNLEVLDAMGAPIPTTQGTVEYMAETVTTAAAAETAEGGASPEADIDYTATKASVATIRAILPVTEEQLADEPTIRRLLDERLIALGRDRVNQQLVIGDGTAPNLQGVKGARTAANDITAAYASNKVTDPILAAVEAIRKVRTTGRTPATHILMSGAYTTAVLTQKDTNGNYLMGAPSEVLVPAIFGVPIAESDDLDDASSANNIMAIAGDFVRQSSLYLRKDAMVEAGWNDTDFSKYQISLRVVVRAAAVWYRAASFIGVKRG